ncbi:MAG: tetratricopeptide repeat protein [Candidatus Thiodiazotropha sp. 6PLUC2]
MVTRSKIKIELAPLFYILLLGLGFSSALMADECQPVVARMVSTQGQVEVLRTESKEWQQVERDSKFCPGDQLRVNASSRVGLHLNNDTFLRLSENSSIRFSPPADQQSSWLDLIQGIAHFISRITRPAQVVTPYVNASIEGTEFTVEVSDELSLISVSEGKVRAHNQQGESLISSGQMAKVVKGEAPVVSQIVNPLDAVQWTLYYPPIIDFSDQDTSSNQALLRSYAAYRSGDITEAFKILDEVPVTDNASTLGYRASLNLAVGDIKTAEREIKHLIAVDPENADALALSSIIATIQNRSDEAMSSANQAIESNPGSLSAHLALSYAKQSQFELIEALEAAKEATRLDPESAIAMARLSQLHLMFRQMSEATEAAEKAVAIDPQIALSQTTLGFAHLIQLNLKSAKLAFEQAIKLDQADPMPRLGLGLVTIRGGNLNQGRELLETAVHLDPGSALLRSYLGKAYYEEKRSEEAATQFQLAKQRDPLDPTAWFYDAILKQSENSPVDALNNIQQANQLNKNRAIYRSRLLLDDDQASRNISQAEIYTDLGFQRLALKESWKSINLDPGNSSAHQFLSDAYAGVIRHEIAQVSELLQAQLLQPEIITPISPSAGETNLLAFNDNGPSLAGLNEYNPLFNRQRLSFQASGVTGSNNTRGSEIIAGAFANRGMISAGHFRESSDGFRENNDSDQTITNLFGQFRITSDLSIQGEIKQKEGDFGDLTLRFDPENFDQSLQRSIDSDSYRIGLNYSPDIKQNFIFSASSQKLEDSDSRTGSLVSLDSDGQQYEAKYIYSGEQFDIDGGFGFLSSDKTTTLNFEFFGFITTEQERAKVNQKSAYLYLNYPFTAGNLLVGFDYLDIDDDLNLDKRKINPKIGARIDISNDTSFRVAAFKIVSPEIINLQTSAPTSVIGFNQYFDDYLGAESIRYALALDHSFTENLHSGFEITQREIENEFDDTFLNDETHKEQDHRLYAYYSLNPNIGITGEYSYEKFERDFVEGIIEADRPASLLTQTTALGLTYAHASGLYSKITGNYVDQEIENILPIDTSTDSDQFWVADLTIGFRLPKRMGKIEILTKNLFDKEFNYQSTNPGTGTPQSSAYYPERSFLINAQLWL